MSLVTHSFDLDITPGAIPRVVNVSEYDENREYTVKLIDEGGEYAIPSGTTAKVEGTIGGSGFSENATISGDTITFTLTDSMTAKAGDVWCKIKLTKDSKPIQTCAFILRCDKAGVEADAVIGASGFEEQIVDAVNDWLDEHPPASGGMTEAFKQALLDCFENVAWINDDGQTYYDALYDALYPPVDVLSISAVFTQGSAVIYDTDSLNTLKQYLVVTATMSDSTTQTVTNYTLSGTLTEGTSTITVSYGGKTTTFNVNVSEGAIKVFKGKGTSGSQIVDNANRALSVEIPVTAGDLFRFSWSDASASGIHYSPKFIKNDGEVYTDQTFDISDNNSDLWVLDNGEHCLITLGGTSEVGIPSGVKGVRLLFRNGSDSSAPITQSIAGRFILNDTIHPVLEGNSNEFV